MKIYSTDQKVTIKWFVWAGDQKMRHESSMRGTWGWDAECSCGWQTRTGGAIRSSVESDVQLHKTMEQKYSYKAGA